MPRARTILVVDDSKLVTSLMRETLRPHCAEVVVASSLAEARAKIATLTAADLVLSDLYLGDGTGFELAAAISAQTDRPVLIICSSQATPENKQKALALGAVAFLAKPLSANAVVTEWNKRDRATPLVDRAERVRVLAQVFVSDAAAEEPVFAYDVYDLSRSGAFLLTNGPLPIGVKLWLTLVSGSLTVKTWVKVVRVQEPSWHHVGGVGVAFEGVDEVNAAVLDKMIG